MPGKPGRGPFAPVATRLHFIGRSETALPYTSPEGTMMPWYPGASRSWTEAARLTRLLASVVSAVPVYPCSDTAGPTEPLPASVL